MPSTIAVNTACESARADRLFGETCAEILRRKAPNFLRLYLNPYVAQACYCLTRFAADNWPAPAGPSGYQAFLANSLEEALSGAIKLARYHANVNGLPTAGLIVDEESRLVHFAHTVLPGIGNVEYLPAVRTVRHRLDAAQLLASCGDMPGFVVLFLSPGDDARDTLSWLPRKNSIHGRFPLLIACMGMDQLAEYGGAAYANGRAPRPDIVVFDESLTNGEVPFGAFVATKALYRHWNRRGMATFHSTTYQPNTISTLQLMNCLRKQAPRLIEELAPDLDRIERDAAFRLETFRELYSPALARVISAVRFQQDKLQASGSYVYDGNRPIFDGVAGVACSVRGHNPDAYLSELAELGESTACRDELAERLHDLTGLPHFVPAVSGASAVEHALKLGLVCQHPRNYILALQGGFGGKTLLALTGTWKAALKEGLDPLYPNVVYIDPFSADAERQIDEAFERYPIGIVQCEIIQAVGGVREIPGNVLRKLVKLHDVRECLLFVDEVQTGMFRTGPFVRSKLLGLNPDLLTIGKATSDMMFPLAATLYSDALRLRIEERACDLPEILEGRYGFPSGYRTLLNTLRRAEEQDISGRVRQRGELFADLLREELQFCSNVKEIRHYGLLIGIELDVNRLVLPILKRLMPRLRLLAMLRSAKFPVMMGYCQYEPHVLKLTPPLSVTEDEVRRICETIGDVLRTSSTTLVARSLSEQLSRSRVRMKQPSTAI